MKIVFLSLFFVALTTQVASAQALLVGVRNDGTSEPLKYAFIDIAKVENVLLDHGSRVTKMLGMQRSEKPTRSNILAHWESVCRNTSHSETAIFYGSLHGTDIDGKTYIVPVGGNIDRPETTMIYFNDLLDIAAKHRVKNCLVVWDCCRDKAETDRIIRFKSLTERQSVRPKSLAPISTQSIDDAVSDMPQNYSVIFSCGQGQRSVEDSNLRGSVFTHFFVEAFSEKEAANGKGVLTANSIFDYVSSRVENYTESIDILQTPEIIGRFSSGRMALATLDIRPETII